MSEGDPVATTSTSTATKKVTNNAGAAKRTVGKSKPAKQTATRTKTRTKSQAKSRAKSAGEQEVAIERRGGERRKTADRRKRKEPVTVERRTLERRAKVVRRRQIDPTTCERDYSNDEVEFMRAMDAYKRTSGRMFPTCSEILEVIRDLGYEKPPTHEHAGAESNLD